MLSADQVVRLGLEHQMAGRLEEAERVYRQVLDAVPKYADAWNLLGMIYYARGELHQEQFEVTALGEATAAPFQVPWLGGNGSKPKENVASLPAAPAAEPEPARAADAPAAEAPPPEAAAGAELAAQPVDAEGESPILGRFLEET